MCQFQEKEPLTAYNLSPCSWVAWRREKETKVKIWTLAPHEGLISALVSLPVKMELLLRHSSVQCSCSVVSDSLRPREPQHARPLGVYPNPCPFSQ